MLGVVVLRRRSDAQRVFSVRLGRDDDGAAAVGDRAAVEQLQWRGDRSGREHVRHADGAAKLRALMLHRMLAHQHRQLGQIRLGAAEVVQVARRQQAVISRNRRAQRHLVDRVPDLRQHLHRRVTALPGQAVLAADHQHAPRHARTHQRMRQHHQPETGGPAQLHRVGIARVQAVMLGKHRREHQVRLGRGVAAQQSIDVAARQAGVGQRQVGGLAHQV